MIYVETTKPKSLAESDVALYYMYANGLDTYNKLPIFREIYDEDMLECAYKVYKKVEEDKNNIK